MKNIIPFVFVLFTISGFAQNLSEDEYSDLINLTLQGEREVKIDGGRVDILTDTYAVEVERAHKWKNSIGQALWYALNTNKTPGIVLILENDTEYKYFIMLSTALDYAGLRDKVKIWQFPQDFPEAAAAYRATLPEEVPDPNAKYWKSTYSDKRHNESCEYFENSNGGYCKKTEGIACRKCGG